ncbi:MAG: RNA polymerase sigma factor [Chloroflexi bacterium]|nr:MAG: RNA polymerase sigma factor [Chloroflexota bacterium]
MSFGPDTAEPPAALAAELGEGAAFVAAAAPSLAPALAPPVAGAAPPQATSTENSNERTARFPSIARTLPVLTRAWVSAFYMCEMADLLTFGALLERHEKEIFAYALRLVGDRDDADDVYQETFLAAFRAWPPPRRGQERAWLYRIATNKVIDRARRRKHLVRMSDLRLAAPERDGVSLADLAAAIKVLPEGQRAAFVLRKVEGLEYAEVAQALECSEDAARQRVAEAMKKVREAMR